MELEVLKGEKLFMAIEGGKNHSVAEIEALPEGERAELIDGELFMMASPTLTHQNILGWLYVQIRLYISGKKGKCVVVPAPFGVYLIDDGRNYVEPDIAVICDRDKLCDKGCYGAPDWVIEIVSPSSSYMDYVRKRNLYQSAGVREYWVVDSDKEIITVYDFERKKEPNVYSFNEQIKARIYEDLIIDFSKSGKEQI